MKTASPALDKKIPILGPRFVPPTQDHAQRRRGEAINVNVEDYYLKPLTVVHPFYFQDIAKCPKCSAADVTWDSWTTYGHREVHGVKNEETALGYQLRCKSCEGRSKTEGQKAHHTAQNLLPIQIRPFSDPFDEDGYAGTSISDDLITDLYADFGDRTRHIESDSYLRTLDVICASMGATFRITNKATVVVEKDGKHTVPLRGGLVSAVNELNETITWVRSHSRLEILSTT